MSVPQRSLVVLSESDERRRFQRARVALFGCYMLTDRREYPCEVQDMSPGGVALVAPVAGRTGERVIAYVDHLGRLEGRIVRTNPIGFAMTIAATLRKRDKLAAQLTWLANRYILGLPEERSHQRIVPRNPRTTMILPNGILVSCQIVQMSVSGAAVQSETKPPVGTLIWLGKTQGRVVHISDDGFAIEFACLQDPDYLEENVTGW
jgi:hypothetical protein